MDEPTQEERAQRFRALAHQRRLRHRQLLGRRLGTHPHFARLLGAGYLQRRFGRHARSSGRQRLPRRSDGAGAHHLRRHFVARVRGPRERVRRRPGRHGQGRFSSRPMPAWSADRSKTPAAARTRRSSISVSPPSASPPPWTPHENCRFPFMLTARAENYLHGRPDLDDTIRRLQAFQSAGADVLFAPGLPDLAAVRTVCSVGAANP